MSEVHVRGLAELQKFLDTLPVKLEKNVMRGALRAGMSVVTHTAMANIHSISEDLAASLNDKHALRTKSRGGTVTAILAAGYGFGKKGKPPKNLPIWVEYGTAAHTITGKGKGWLSFGGVFARSVQHPGAKPHPFMRPALDSQAQNSVVAAAEYMKKRLATKEGLDTSDVQIEVLP